MSQGGAETLRTGPGDGRPPISDPTASMQAPAAGSPASLPHTAVCVSLSCHADPLYSYTHGAQVAPVSKKGHHTIEQRS